MARLYASDILEAINHVCECLALSTFRTRSVEDVAGAISPGVPYEKMLEAGGFAWESDRGHPAHYFLLRRILEIKSDLLFQILEMKPDFE